MRVAEANAATLFRGTDPLRGGKAGNEGGAPGSNDCDLACGSAGNVKFGLTSHSSLVIDGSRVCEGRTVVAITIGDITLSQCMMNSVESRVVKAKLLEGGKKKEKKQDRD